MSTKPSNQVLLQCSSNLKNKNKNKNKKCTRPVSKQYNNNTAITVKYCTYHLNRLEKVRQKVENNCVNGILQQVREKLIEEVWQLK